MCLLTFFPAGIKPDTTALFNGTTFNDDGHGYAIVDVDDRRILIGRGMEAREMIDEFALMRDLYPDGPAMFHSRLATDGSVNLLNCHPFVIGGDSRTVLAHNGIMPIRPRPGDPRSDTRIVAEDHIPKAFGTLRRRRARLAFQRWLTSWNKVVILTVDRRYREHAFILNESQGKWVNGIWYSNDGYLPFGGIGYSVSKGHNWWDDAPKPHVIGGKSTDLDKTCECWVCGRTSPYYLDECPHCGVCFDCGESPRYCQCYVPAKVIDGPARG
jgi:glutamine amidotransferase